MLKFFVRKRETLVQKINKRFKRIILNLIKVQSFNLLLKGIGCVIMLYSLYSVNNRLLTRRNNKKKK